MIKNTVLFLLTILIQQASFALFNEVEIRTDSMASIYFDQQALQEIIEASQQDSVEVVAQKLNDYFSSAPFSIQKDAQFYTKDYSDNRSYFNLGPKTPRHAHVIFVLRMNATQNFAKGYALLTAQLAADFLPAVQAAMQLGMSVRDAEERYSYFYNCLQNAATGFDSKEKSCVNSAILGIGFAKPEDGLFLANLYMKMYRMSRLAFGSKTMAVEKVFSKDKKFSFEHKVYTRHYDSLDLQDPELVKICDVVEQNFGKIIYLRDSFLRGELPTIGWSDIKWRFLGGQEESQKRLKISYAIPEMYPLTGGLFDTSGGRRGREYDSFEGLKRLCPQRRVY